MIAHVDQRGKAYTSYNAGKQVARDLTIALAIYSALLTGIVFARYF